MHPTPTNVLLHSKLNSFELLPTELLDIIFDYSHQDIASIKACATVCNTLRRVCQAHIFHTVTLERLIFNVGTGPVASHDHFLDLISTSSHLASLVRDLRFTKPRNGGSNSVPISKEERVIHQGIAAQILVALPHLKTLVITTQTGSLMWRRLSAALTTALSDVVQLPTLRHLDLGVTWEAPASFFRSFKCLWALRFAELNMPFPDVDSLATANEIDGSSCGPVGGERLHSLSISSPMSFPSVDTLFLRPTPLLDITHLQCLTLPFFGDDLTRQILEVCGKSLYTLNIHLQQRGQPSSHEPDIGFQCLQRVTSLTFFLTITSVRSYESSTIHWLSMITGALPSPECLENLTIVFEIPCPTDVLNWEEGTWPILDTLLVGFPGLREVNLLFYLRSPGDLTADRKRLSVFVRGCVVRLPDADILKVDIISRLPSCFL